MFNYKSACKKLTNDSSGCAEIFSNTWPMYNQTNDSQFPLHLRLGEIDKIYYDVFQKYENVFDRRFEILIIEAVRSSMVKYHTPPVVTEFKYSIKLLYLASSKKT